MYSQERLAVQKVSSNLLTDVYSSTPKINNVLRTLFALHGRDELWAAVCDYARSAEVVKWSAADIYELYAATKWIVVYGE